jgi:methionyl-tRNA synthetase
MMEYVQADIWVRFQRLQGHKVTFVCADDAHGAPIMLKAEAEGITPEELVARVAECTSATGSATASASTHSTRRTPTRTASSRTSIFEALKKSGFIETKTIEQFFDPVKGMFLPDRYIKGECPKCATPDQYGDSCENCGAVYAPTDLKNPFSALTGAKPILKKSEHFFFKLSDPRCVAFLKEWTQEGRLQPEVANKVREWLEGGLNDWDITRDPPYFGIEIPGAPGKYFYVWLDAPIGYLASLKNLLDKKGPDAFAKYLATQARADPLHRQGHHLLPHALLAAMLKFSERKSRQRVRPRLPQMSGEKMSKSRGISVSPQKYCDLGSTRSGCGTTSPPSSTPRRGPGFQPGRLPRARERDLVGKYVNIASRAAGFIGKRFAGKLSDEPALAGRELKHKMRGNLAAPAPDDEQAPAILFEVRSFADAIAADYEAREFSKAIRQVMFLADRVNQYVDEQKPWEIAKEAGQDGALQWFCTLYLELFRILTIYLKPVLPKVAEEVEAFLALPKPLAWEDVGTPVKPGHTVQPYRHLISASIPSRSTSSSSRRQTRSRGEGAWQGRGHGGDRRLQARADRAAPAPGAPAGGRDHLHRRLRQDRPAHRAHRRRGARRRRRQAPQAHARHRPRQPHRLRRDPLGVHAEGPHRPPHRHGREPRAAQDALRRIPGHGARRRRRELDLPARAGFGGRSGHAHQVEAVLEKKSPPEESGCRRAATQVRLAGNCVEAMAASLP